MNTEAVYCSDVAECLGEYLAPQLVESIMGELGQNSFSYPGFKSKEEWDEYFERCNRLFEGYQRIKNRSIELLQARVFFDKDLFRLIYGYEWMEPGQRVRAREGHPELARHFPQGSAVVAAFNFRGKGPCVLLDGSQDWISMAVLEAAGEETA